MRPNPSKALLLCLALLALLAAIPQSTTTAQTTTGGSTSLITPALSASIQKAMAQANIPGAIVGIWRGNAREVRGFGVANRQTKQPIRPEMFVRIGSITKSFTITALLRLVDRGLVKLDDPIAKYVPGVPNGKNITLRQLAEMRSGIASYTENPKWQVEWLSNTTRRWTPAELLPYAFSQPTHFQPGTFFHYSNTNTILLGLAVEAVTGRPLADVVREQVIVPAGLKNTSWPNGANIPAPHPTGYTEQTLDGREADATNRNPSWGWAAGAMISTVADLRSWAVELTTGRLLSKASQAQRTKVVQIPGNPSGVGYGLGVLDLGGWIGHNGDLPGFSSVAYHYPDGDVTMVVVTNTDEKVERDGTPIAPAAKLAEVISQAILPAHPYRFPTLPEQPR